MNCPKCGTAFAVPDLKQAAREYGQLMGQKGGRGRKKPAQRPLQSPKERLGGFLRDCGWIEDDGGEE